MTDAAGQHQIVLILDDDVMITEGLAAGLARSGRTVVTCNDLESGEIVVEWLKPSHVLTDVRLTGTFGYEGLDFIRFVKRHSPDTRVILMTGDAPDALQFEASQRGAVGFLRKPFEVSEVDAVLNLMAPARVGSADWPDIIRIPLLDDIVKSDCISTVFQPIVRLSSGDRVGYEALTRCRTDSPYRNPETLFTYAHRKHQITELESACVQSAFASGERLAASAALFVNVHPAVFSSGRAVRDIFTNAAKRHDIDLNRVVLEITEQGSLSHDRKVIDAIHHLKETGIRFAFDDVGVAYSHLPFMDAVRPSFLKISQAFGTGFELDQTKMKIVKNLLSLSADFNCELILEGVETAATAAAAADLGIKYAQGYYFAHPAAAETWIQAA